MIKKLLGALAVVLMVAGLMPVPCAAVPAPDLGEAGNFAVLALEGGTITINSCTTLVGDVGYCRNVVIGKNQKAEDFTGTVYVHSTTEASFNANTNFSNFLPTGGFKYGSVMPAVNTKLEQASADAIAASAYAASLASTHVLGALGDNDSRVVTSVGPLNVISLTSLNYNSDTLELVSRSGFDDLFLFNVQGSFQFSQSQIKLTGVSPEHVMFNFPTDSTVSIVELNKSSNLFYGTILAPTSSVEYHNPATFEGAIIALNINLHSDFNLIEKPFESNLGALKIIKFNDLDDNGVFDGQDYYMPDWEFLVTGHGYSNTVVTGQDGTVMLTGLVVQQYTITETVQDGWEPTTANPQYATVVPNGLVTVTFGNFQSGGGGNVPEPAGLGMIGIAALAAMRRKRS